MEIIIGEFTISELDKDNEVGFDIDGDREHVSTYLTIDQTIELIRFLETQVETFNNKYKAR